MNYNYHISSQLLWCLFCKKKFFSLLWYRKWSEIGLNRTIFQISVIHSLFIMVQKMKLRRFVYWAQLSSLFVMLCVCAIIQRNFVKFSHANAQINDSNTTSVNFLIDRKKFILCSKNVHRTLTNQNRRLGGGTREVEYRKSAAIFNKSDFT